MPQLSTRKIVLCALFAALTTVSTLVIQIPSPMQGYINLGDAFVLFGAFFLGPFYGTLSAGLGSMLADVLTGYIIYAPATLVIKSLMAVVAFYVFDLLKKCLKRYAVCTVLAGIVAELLMVTGYFGYAALIMTEGWAAAASIPGNLVQGAVGVVVSTLLVVVFNKLKIFNDNEKR
ncbi:MAG: ECF transporter S component [Clostridia bacterium]|nr:ECF transporter S component [Clostridia bacterium]